MVAAPNYPHFDVDKIRAHTDCQRLAEQLLGEGKRSGRALIYSNPGIQRQQQTPSFTVYPNGYKDFATGESSDCFGLIMLVTGCDYRAALAYAASFAGLSTDAPALRIIKPTLQVAQKPRQTTAHWRTNAEQEVERAEAYLWGGTLDAQAVLAYLRGTVRGLTDETIRAARLGYNPDFHKTAITKEDGKAAYLMPGIIIPWYDPDGQIVAVRVRCRVGNLAHALDIDPDTNRVGKLLPKYSSLSGSIMTGALYGTIRPGCVVLLVEGEFDVLIGQQNAPEGVCVVTLGSASGSLSPAWRDVLTAAPRVVLALDTDDAGQKAASRLVEALHKANVYTSAVPRGKDLTDYITIHAGLTVDLITSARRLPLPDSWRAAFNKYTPPTIAPTVELFIEAQRAGLFDEADGVTVADLVTLGQQLGRNVSKVTIQHALAASVELFPVLPPLFSYNKEESVYPGETGIKSVAKRGRPQKRYRLATPAVLYTSLLAYADPRILESHFVGDAAAPIRAALLEALDIDTADTLAASLIAQHAQTLDTETQREALNAARADARDLRKLLACVSSSPLPAGWHFVNAAEYRACFARALIEMRDGAQVRRAEFAKQIGISPRTVYSVQHAAGLCVKHVVVEHAATCAAELEPHYSREHAGYTQQAVVNGQMLNLDNKNDQRDARAAFAAGKVVTLRIQQANTIHIASALQPIRVTPVPMPKNVSAVAVLAAVGKKPVIRPPKKAAFFGTRHDPAWAEQQINNILSAVTVWRRNGAVIVNTKTHERIIYSVRQVLALLLAKSPISMARANQLDGLRALAERESQIAGNAPGVGRAAFMATLTKAEREGVERFAAGDTW